MPEPTRTNTLRLGRAHPGPNAARARMLRDVALAAIAHEQAIARRRRIRRLWVGSLLLSAGAVAGVFQSCAGSKPANAKPDAAAIVGKVPAATDNLPEPSPGKSPFDQAATDLQALFEGATADAGSASALQPFDTIPTGSRAFAAPTLPPAPPADRPPLVAPIDPVPAPSRAAASPTIEPRAAALAAELGRARRAQSAEDAALLRALTGLIELEALTPGSTRAAIESAIARLTPADAAAARLAHGLILRLAADPLLIADPDALRAELISGLEQIIADAPDNSGAAADTFGITTAALCSRVESFGRYQPLTGNRFLAGRVNAAIVYVELDHFTQQPTGDSTLAVELSTRVELFHDDGSRQWRAPEATVRDTARTRRRDFFVVQRIDLPANLSVGKYNLKIALRDRLAADAPEAEVIIPIQIVADPGLLGASDIQRPTVRPSAFNPGAPIAGPEPIATPISPTPSPAITRGK